mgnify:CR=1 FL=1
MGVQINGDTGNVIATKGTYSGNVTIGGTLTYEDVTNIDAVGIITARSGIEIGARPGVAASISVDGNAIFSGITTITNRINVVSSENTLGILTSANNGANFDLFDDDTQSRIRTVDGKLHLYADLGNDVSDSAIRFFVDGANEKLRIDSNGYLGIGTDSVNTPLHVHNSTVNGVALFESGDVYCSLVFQDSNSNDSGKPQFGVQGDDFRWVTHDGSSSAERIRLKNSGELLINQSTVNTYVDGAGYSQTPLLQVVSNDNVSTMMSLRYNSGAGASGRRATFAFARTADGTAVSNNSVLGEVLFMGEGNSAILKAASVRAEVDGTPGASDMPGRLVFSTVPDGSATLAERLRITQNGQILIGHDTASTNFHDPQTTTDRAPQIQIHGSNSVQSSAALVSWNSNAGSYYSNALFLAHSGSSTIGTNSIVSGSNTLGSIVFSGDDGDEFIKGAMISAHVDGTPGADDMPARLQFWTNGGSDTLSERARIDASGNFFVDCTSEPTQGDSGVRLTNGSYHTFARATNTASVIRSFGNNGEFRTLGSGNVQNTNNSYGQISDVSLKENIVDANSQWNDIKAVKVRNFNFKESTGYNTHKQIGVVAQELESSGLNGLVETNPDELYVAGDEIPDGKNIGDVKEKGYKTVKYSVLYMKAIKALQEAIAKIETLEAEVAALKSN